MGNKTVILNEECDVCNKYFAETCEKNIFAKGTELTIYRKTNNERMLTLAIGEFHSTFKKMVFIIPTFNESESSFIDEAEYAHFLDFSFFKSVQGWAF